MAKLEKAGVETPILRMIDARGGLRINYSAGGFQRGGISDILACISGRFIAIECKRSGQHHVRPKQKAFLCDVANAGGVAMITDDPTDAERLFDALADGMPLHLIEGVQHFKVSEIEIYSNTSYVGLIHSDEYL